ncbi:hypothetical protein B1NLA3E_07060 [Bacillus sp. 1NLA3E]|nr:hypothetical protein B1NLA3E_07060 [Bacillus sp. 1NLA3E]
MMHNKKLYVDAILEESKVIKEANSLDTQLQTLIIASGRKQQVYSDNIVKSNPTNRNPRFGGTYLAMTHQELTRFIQGTYTASDIDYLKKYAHKKDLT